MGIKLNELLKNLLSENADKDEDIRERVRRIVDLINSEQEYDELFDKWKSKKMDLSQVRSELSKLRVLTLKYPSPTNKDRLAAKKRRYQGLVRDVRIHKLAVEELKDKYGTSED